MPCPSAATHMSTPLVSDPGSGTSDVLDDLCEVLAKGDYGTPLGPISAAISPITPTHGSTTKTQYAPEPTPAIDAVAATCTTPSDGGAFIIQPLPDTLPGTLDGLKLGDVVVTVPTQSNDAFALNGSRTSAQSMWSGVVLGWSDSSACSTSGEKEGSLVLERTVGGGLSTIGLDGMVGTCVDALQHMQTPTSDVSHERKKSKTGLEVKCAFGSCPLLQSAIEAVLNQIHPDHEIHSDAVEAMMAMTWLYLEAVASKAVGAARLGAAVGVAQVQDAVRQVLSAELAKHAVSEGKKAVAKFEADSDNQDNDGGVAAGLQFPISPAQSRLEAASKQSSTSIDKLAGVYLTATAEYMAAEVLELSGNAASDEGCITVENVNTALEDDEELASTASRLLASRLLYFKTLGFNCEPFMNLKVEAMSEANAETKADTQPEVEAQAQAQATTTTPMTSDAQVLGPESAESIRFAQFCEESAAKLAEAASAPATTTTTTTAPGALWLVYPAPTSIATDLGCACVTAVTAVQALVRGIMARRHHDDTFGIGGIEPSAELLVGIADGNLKDGVRLIKGRLADSTDCAAAPRSLTASTRRVDVVHRQGQDQAQASTRSMITIGLQRQRMWNLGSTDQADGIIVGGKRLKFDSSLVYRADWTPRFKEVFTAGARHRLVAAEPFNAVLPGYDREKQHKPGDKYWEGSLGNASDLRGNIAVIERGIATFEDKYIVAVKAGGETEFGRNEFGTTINPLRSPTTLTVDPKMFIPNPAPIFA
mmetsp:Transcript_75555/g.214913  ORF Transcript_75555/g.214913 Transcript_75555/m.214913 type:complete len:764 (-) Transcript_75555:1826-4117(-)